MLKAFFADIGHIFFFRSCNLIQPDFVYISGYGNLAPTTHLSRILMIFYGLFGIPINGILLANLGEYFGLQVNFRTNSYSNDFSFWAYNGQLNVLKVLNIFKLLYFVVTTMNGSAVQVVLLKLIIIVDNIRNKLKLIK